MKAIMFAQALAILSMSCVGPAPAPRAAPATADAGTPGDPAELDGEEETQERLRRLTASGPALDDDWTTHARGIFPRWQAAASPALVAKVTFEPTTCHRDGCVTRMTADSEADADEVTMDFFNSQAIQRPGVSVFRSPVGPSSAGRRKVEVVWTTTRAE